MPTSDLPPELWMRVLEHLRKPIPEARSQCARSELRQPDLCRAARVCQLFSSACEILLYTHIVTDRFPLLLGDDLPARKRLFAHTRSLRIEYCEKDGSPEYKDLIGQGKAVWKEVGLSTQDFALQIMRESADEVEDLSDCLTKLAKRGSISGTFPRLETVAIASIFGHQNNYWAQYEGLARKAPPGTDAPEIEACTNKFYDLLRSSRIQHFCVRDAHGPLALPFLSTKSSLPSFPFTRTCHFPHRVHALHLPLGHPVQWVADFPPSDRWSDIMTDLSKYLTSTVGFRQGAVQRYPGDFQATDKVELDLYCSTDDLEVANAIPNGVGLPQPAQSSGPAPPDIRLHNQRALTAMLGEQMQRVLRERSGRPGSNDTINWYPRFLAPTCQACGSRPPT